MLTLVLGFTCDYPTCGQVHTRRHASADIRGLGDDLDPPDGWTVVQIVGKDDTALYCPSHHIKFENGAAVLARRVGFSLPSDSNPKENPQE